MTDSKQDGGAKQRWSTISLLFLFLVYWLALPPAFLRHLPPLQLPATEPRGSANCYWNGHGSSVTTRLKDLLGILSGLSVFSVAAQTSSAVAAAAAPQQQQRRGAGARARGGEEGAGGTCGGGRGGAREQEYEKPEEQELEQEEQEQKRQQKQK